MSRFLVNPIKRHNDIVTRVCDGLSEDHQINLPIKVAAHTLVAVTTPIALVMPISTLKKIAAHYAAKNR